MSGLAALALLGAAQADTYNAANNQLTVDSVQVGNTIYTGVVVTVGNVLAIGGSKPATSPVAATCTAANFTLAAYNAIQTGMTVDQVNQIIGCQYLPSLTVRYANFVVYQWGAVGLAAHIAVYFDATGTVVTAQSGIFKTSGGF
jgi:hypothetical protein